ncbi:MAG: hypothetical protein EPO40_33155 [Myxococcaceae bacterium]|nr:MAG: hypothetical protein EPO40_33155 [Myxococcaceae bacterium]
MTKPTFASVTERPCACDYLSHAADDPRSPIVFDPKLNEYNFEYPSLRSDEAGKAYLRIYHCPFCGGAAPESKRDQLFAVISPEEKRRLNQLLSGIKSVEDAFSVLGTPDHDDPHGLTAQRPEREGSAPTRQSYRSLTYSQLSDTADVILTDYRADGVHIALQGKYVGLSGAGAEPGSGAVGQRATRHDDGR